MITTFPFLTCKKMLNVVINLRLHIQDDHNAPFL